MQLDLAELEQLKERVAGQYHELTSGDLEGMMADCRYAIETSPLLSLNAVRKTGAPVHQIEVECQPRDPATSPDAVTRELKTIWLEHLCYDDFEAHTVLTTDHAIVLDFLTVARGPRLFATGMIVVRGSTEERTGRLI
jgi:hypothetical protein